MADEDTIARLLAAEPALATRAEWAVHADELGVRGDPRAELIGLELRAEESDEEATRAQLMARHSQLRAEIERGWSAPKMASSRFVWRRGYLTAVELESKATAELGQLIAKILASPAASLLSRLAVDAPPAALPGIVDAIASAPRRIEALELKLIAPGRHEPVLVPEARTLALCRALPSLRVLSLVGRELFEDLSHPGLERLELQGHDAILGLAQWTSLPRVERLSLALLSGSRTESIADRAPQAARRVELLSGDGLPALRCLDLSRNAPGCKAGTIHLGGRFTEPWFQDLLGAGVLGQLDELILAPPPTRALGRQLLLAPHLRDVPRLRLPLYFHDLDEDARQRWLPQLELGRIYAQRNPNHIHGREVISVEVGERGELWLSFSAFMDQVESRYPELQPPAVEALCELLNDFDELAYEDGSEGLTHLDVPFDHFAAIIAVTFVGDVGDGLGALRTYLREARGHCESVRLRKIWGW